MKTHSLTTASFISLLIGLFVCSSARSQQRLVVSLHDGQQYSVSVASIDSLSFTDHETPQEVTDLVSPSAYHQRENKWYHPLENQGIADYLRDFEYDADDYSYHHIFDYRGLPYLDKRQDQPYGVHLYWPKEIAGENQYLLVSERPDMLSAMRFDFQTKDSSVVLYNLIPARTYYYNILNNDSLVRSSHFQTLGQLRMLRADSLNNLRDLGGWPTTDGRRIRYGRIIRGVELTTVSPHEHAQFHRMTDADRRMLRTIVGIQAELDLRGITEIPSANKDKSPLGDDISYFNFPSFPYTDISKGAQYGINKILLFLLEQLREDKPIYMHCVWGADRTGILCMLLEGLLGVTESSIDKDYEITSFCGDSRFRDNEIFCRQLNYIKSLQGLTLRDKFEQFWLQMGVTQTEIEEFRELMLELIP